VDGTGKIGVKTSISWGHPNYPAQIFGHDFISLESTMAAYRGLAFMMDILIEVITNNHLVI
jgi:hypothetical protein